MKLLRIVSVVICVLSVRFALADGPADNNVATVRQIPPPGVMIAPADREALQAELKQLNERLAGLRANTNPMVQKYLPDVEIFARAVSLALDEDGFYDPKEAERAKDVLKEGMVRAEALAKGETPWRTATGTVVRGFRSKLDGTVQPYGIVCPGPLTEGMRADIWCRGRSERGLEMQFIASRMTSTYPQPAPGVMMIHPFGRYCNANKLAGEVDTLEALEHALSEYPINPQRVAIRGFSMGGAAAWHLAVHYPDKWFAANPGAGFSETPDFLKVFQKEELHPYPFEEKLWQYYDCPVWVRNLRGLPTIAYSGEIDCQKQAADIMAAASWNLPENERFELTHIIAPKTAHSISPAASAEIEKRLETLDGMRSDKFPLSVKFTTTTLKYNKSHWVTIHSLKEHWKPAFIRATSSGNGASDVAIYAENVGEFSLELPADQVFNAGGLVIRFLNPEKDAGEQVTDNTWREEVRGLQEKMKSDDSEVRKKAEIELGVLVHQRRRELRLPTPDRAERNNFKRVALRSDKSWGVRIRCLDDGNWELVSPLEPPSKELRKQHGLQGPIDDAFMGPFLFVKPSATGRYPEVDKWVDAEFNRAVREWHRQMRGDARVKTSEELKPEDIENYHLVLWGDPQSNPTLARVADKLPIAWNADHVSVGDRKFDAKTHAPVLIYPNPLNPEKYVVLNSSFTYREYDYLNNARQVPKLPDWAVIDLTTPSDARWPGKIAAADFFGEKWELKPVTP